MEQVTFPWFLLQGTLGLITDKCFHSKLQISNIILLDGLLLVPEVKMNHFLESTDVFRVLAVKSVSWELLDKTLLNKKQLRKTLNKPEMLQELCWVPSAEAADSRPWDCRIPASVTPRSCSQSVYKQQQMLCFSKNMSHWGPWLTAHRNVL